MRLIGHGLLKGAMSEALLPSVPPLSPFEAYTIILLLPFLMRLIFVAPPLLDLSHKFLPKDDRTKHARWVLDRIKRLNAERFWLIVLNELLAVVLPGAIAVAARLYIGPIGWESWEIPFLGLALLLLAGMMWVGYDFGRVARSRGHIRRLAELDIDTAKQAVDTAVVGRDLLKAVRGFRIPRPWASEPEQGAQQEAGNPVFGAVSSVLNMGADVLDMALDQVRVPAGDAVDRMDSEIQTRISERVEASKRSMLTGTLFAVFPLVVLLGLPRLL
ncbi:MAG: hypothetical protein CL414_05740 [Acidimicrobiaceae bacterium]|nr:hypothetical protein [Acidimicrobiaceae bacterium]